MRSSNLLFLTWQAYPVLVKTFHDRYYTQGKSAWQLLRRYATLPDWRRLQTNLRHAVQKRALAGSQCLHACSHSRQNLHDEGQDDQARHSTRDLLPACNVVGAVPMPCAYHLFCNCWCAVTSRVHAERTPSEDYHKAMQETHRCTALNWHASGN